MCFAMIARSPDQVLRGFIVTFDVDNEYLNCHCAHYSVGDSCNHLCSITREGSMLFHSLDMVV